MYDTKEEDGRLSEDVTDPVPTGTTVVPPLRLAGIDEDDMWESHVVRGID